MPRLQHLLHCARRLNAAMREPSKSKALDVEASVRVGDFD